MTAGLTTNWLTQHIGPHCFQADGTRMEWSRVIDPILLTAKGDSPLAHVGEAGALGAGGAEPHCPCEARDRHRSVMTETGK